MAPANALKVSSGLSHEIKNCKKKSMKKYIKNLLNNNEKINLIDFYYKTYVLINLLLNIE